MLKAMIVDDEAPARSELKFLLDELGQDPKWWPRQLVCARLLKS